MLRFFNKLEQEYLLRKDLTEFDLLAFRVCYCLYLAFEVYMDISGQIARYRASVYYFPVSFFKYVGLAELPSEQIFLSLMWGTIFSLIGLALGYKRRIFAVISLVLFLYYNAIYYGMSMIPSSGYIVHSRNIIPFILMSFIFVDSLPLKKGIGAQLFLPRSRVQYSCIVMLMCFAFTAAILNRFIYNPWGWLSGEVLSSFFMHYGYVSQNAWVSELGRSSLLMFLGVFFTTFVEIFCWVVLFPVRYRWVMILLTITFHYLIYLVDFANFITWFGTSYLIFIPYSNLYLKVRNSQ